MGPKRNSNAKVKIRLTLPQSILRQKVVEVEVTVNSTWVEVLRGVGVNPATLSRIKEEHRISSTIDSRKRPNCVRIWTVRLTDTVGDFISKFQKNRKVYCARLHKPRANTTTSTGTTSRPNVRPTMSFRSRSLDLPPELEIESASGYESEPSPERNGEFVTNEPNTQRAEELNGHEKYRRDLIEKFEQNSNDNLLLLRQELLDIQSDLDLRESIKARWPRQYNYLHGLFLNLDVRGEADDAEAEDNYQAEEIEMWEDGRISAKTPYAVRTQELITQGIDYKNIKPELVARFSKKDIRNLCLVGKEFRATQDNFDLMEKMEAKWPRSLQHLQGLYG